MGLIKTAEEILRDIEYFEPEFSWEVYEACADCGEAAGDPCISRKHRGPRVHMKNPHKGRKMQPRFNLRGRHPKYPSRPRYNAN